MWTPYGAIGGAVSAGTGLVTKDVSVLLVSIDSRSRVEPSPTSSAMQLVIALHDSQQSAHVRNSDVDSASRIHNIRISSGVLNG